MTRSSEVARPAAFFDVDGTLTRTTTMFDLLRYDAAERGVAEEGEEFLTGLRRMQVEGGASREAANRRYFLWWSGRLEHEVAELSHRWAAERGADYFHTASLDRLAAHRADGDVLCLVSGSVPVVLDTLAAELGAEHVLAVTMRVVDGRFTGEIDAPMIGARKASAVRAVAAHRALDLDRSSGYGDHLSDLPFLELLGEPVLCGTPGSAEWVTAQRRNWARLHLEG